MTKVSPIIFNKFVKKNYQLNKGAKNQNSNSSSQTQDSFTKSSPDKKTSRKTAGYIALGLAAVAFTGYLLKNRINTKKVKDIIDKATGEILLTATQKNKLESQITKFKGDIAYRNNILNAIGINPDNYALLRSVIGPEEYKASVEAFNNKKEVFSPGKDLIVKIQDSYDLSNVENKIFRFSGHNHTIHSDGSMSTQELLNQAVKYADEVAEKLSKEKNAIMPDNPFTIGITDHDSVESCKEAVKIISENPWKYRNLRVFLGTELSVEKTSLRQELKAPIEIHMLVNAINPFNKELNTLLEKTRKGRRELTNDMINEFSNIIKDVYPKTAEKLNYEDASKLYPSIKLAHTHINYSTKDYLEFRTIFTECFENNLGLLNELKNKGLNPKDYDFTMPKEKFLKNIQGDENQPYWKRYESALAKFTANLLEIPEEQALQKVKVPSLMENILREAERIAAEKQPKFDLQPAYLDMDKAIEFMKKQEHGYMGGAHLGITKMVYYVKHPHDSEPAMKDLIKQFKELGEDKALFIENYYPYFGDFATTEGKEKGSQKWLELIKESTKENNLFNSGGIDTHGKNIFYSERH